MPSLSPFGRQRLLLARQPVLETLDATLDLPQALGQLALHAEARLAPPAACCCGASGPVPHTSASLDRVWALGSRGLLPQVR